MILYLGIIFCIFSPISIFINTQIPELKHSKLYLSLLYFKFEDKACPIAWKPFFAALPSTCTSPLLFDEETFEMLPQDAVIGSYYVVYHNKNRGLGRV